MHKKIVKALGLSSLLVVACSAFGDSFTFGELEAPDFTIQSVEEGVRCDDKWSTGDIGINDDGLILSCQSDGVGQKIWNKAAGGGGGQIEGICDIYSYKSLTWQHAGLTYYPMIKAYGTANVERTPVYDARGIYRLDHESCSCPNDTAMITNPPYSGAGSSAPRLTIFCYGL